MEKGNWLEIKNNLQDTLREIFKGRDLQYLSNYEKRIIIFEFLCENITYDYELLNNIIDFNEVKKPISRNPYLELSNVIYNRTGICNAISQYYKLLLEEVGITSYCVICDDGTPVKHQLNLVYDEKQDTYSFDDITSVIVKRGTFDEYFDYDLETANIFNQGLKELFNNKKWIFLPENYINFLVGREDNSISSLEDLPNNIISLKQSLGVNIEL